MGICNFTAYASPKQGNWTARPSQAGHITLDGDPELAGSATRPPFVSPEQVVLADIGSLMQLLGIACPVCFLISTMALVTRHDVP